MPAARKTKITPAPNPVPPYPTWLDKARIPVSKPANRYDHAPPVKGRYVAENAARKISEPARKAQLAQEAKFADETWTRLSTLRWGAGAIQRMDALPDGWLCSVTELRFEVLQPAHYTPHERVRDRRAFRFSSPVSVPYTLSLNKGLIEVEGTTFGGAGAKVRNYILQCIERAQELADQNQARLEAEKAFVKMFTDAAWPFTFWGDFIRSYPDTYDHINLADIPVPEVKSKGALVLAVPVSRIHSAVSALRTAPPAVGAETVSA